MGDLFRLRVIRAPETPDSVATVAVPDAGTNLREDLVQARQRNLTAINPNAGKISVAAGHAGSG
jgi:hypothetical protein